MAKITPKSSKLIFTDDVLGSLPSNKNIRRGVANKIKGEDPSYRANVQRKVKEQWETQDQSKRITSVSKGITSKWKDTEHIEKQRLGRAKSGQYTDPLKAANFKSPIIGTCKKTGKEIVFLGAKQLKEAGFEPGNVYNCINGIRQSTGGYTWKRA
jgi:hypothetical protein